MYRIRIDLTYTTNNNASTATTNINNVLAGWDDPVIIERATAQQRVVSLVLLDLTEPQAVALKNALTTAWGSTARSGGKVSMVHTEDMSP